MPDDLLTGPLTEHERALVLAGVEWMRAAVATTVEAQMDRKSFPAQLALIDLAGVVEGIAPPLLAPARIGVLGEG